MTKSKREPFAVISYCIEADENALSVGNQTVAGDGKHGFDHVALVDICKRINAAFNARVDEEVKEAVEESEKWRRAAILLGERIGTVGPNGYYSFTADQFFEWVKGLPTEPKP